MSRSGEFLILGIPTALLLGLCDVTASASAQKSRVALRTGLARRVASTRSNTGTRALRSRATCYHVLFFFLLKKLPKMGERR